MSLEKIAGAGMAGLAALTPTAVEAQSIEKYSIEQLSLYAGILPEQMNFLKTSTGATFENKKGKLIISFPDYSIPSEQSSKQLEINPLREKIILIRTSQGLAEEDVTFYVANIETVRTIRFKRNK